MVEVSDRAVELNLSGADVVGDDEASVSLLPPERVQVVAAEATGKQGPDQ